MKIAEVNYTEGLIDYSAYGSGEIDFADVQTGLSAGSSNSVGSLAFYTTTTSPSGVIRASRSEVSRTDFSELWSFVMANSGEVFDPSGTEVGKYGPGDGSTTFDIPDYRGLYPRAASQNSSKLKANGGSFDGGTINITNNDKVQGHYHSASTNAVSLVNTGSPSLTGGAWSFPTASVSVTGATSDGSNGTPRTGDETGGAWFAVNIGVYYE